MSIATEITALNTNLAAAKNAVTAKGGTVGDTGLAGLATEIANIPSGGGNFTCKTSYGRLWYAPFTKSWAITNPDGCSVTIDQVKFSAYVATNPLQDMGGDKQAYFEYDSEAGTWHSWEFETPVENITTAEMEEQLGLTITLESGAEWAAFTISFSATPVVGEWEHLDLNSTDWTNLENSSSDDIVIGDKTIPRTYVRRFEFGTIPTTVPESLFANSGLEELGQIPETYTGSVIDLASQSNLNCPLIIRGGVTLFSQNAAISNFNNVVVYDPTNSQGSNQFVWHSNASVLAFGKNVKVIDLSSISGFDGTLVFPEGLQRLIINWLGSLNTSFVIPQSVNYLSGFYGLNNFTATINVGNLSPSICHASGGLTVENHFLSASVSTAPAYTTGIKIAGPNRAAWLEALPDVFKSTGNEAYRHLIDAGY